MTLKFWPVWGRTLALAGVGMLVVSIASAQFEPPEPPGESESARARDDSDPPENKRDSDNSTPRATERSDPRDRTTDERDRATDEASRERTQPRERTFDDADTLRDAARATERDTRDDSATRYVPDPRPGGMSEPQASGDFQVDRVRSADIGLWFDRSTSDGLIINDIGTGAISRLGFREGDRIYSVNGVRVDSEAAFVRALFDPRWRDQRVNVIIYRHGRPWTVYIQPSPLVQEYNTVAYDPLDDWGLVLDDRYDDFVVVWRVRPRSPAYYAGLRGGDVIVNWQGRRLSGRDEFVRLAGEGGVNDLALDINRNRQTRRIDLDLSGVSAQTSARTSLRPEFDPAGANLGTRGGASVRARVDPNTGDLEVQPEIRTGSRFNGTIDGRLEGQPDGRLDRTNNRTMFPNNAPSGVPTPGTGVRGTIDVPGVPGGVRVEGDTRRGIFGPRRP